MTPSAEVIARIEKIIGQQVLQLQSIQGGYTPAARWKVITKNGAVFTKMGTTPLTSLLLRREAQIYQSMTGSFMPDFFGWNDHVEFPLLVIEDLSEAAWPPPWGSERIDQVLQAIETMHHTTADLPQHDEIHPHRKANWGMVAQEPERLLNSGWADQKWLDEFLPTLMTAEAGCSTAGDAVTHWDIRSDNICFTSKGALLIDWPEACLSNPKLDLGFWLPSLAYEADILPEEILPDAFDVAAWVAGFFAARAGLPVIPDAPFVRQVQQDQLATALPWACRALEIPVPSHRA